MTTYNYFTLSDPEATSGTIAFGINASGQIVGYYFGSGGISHGFLYSNGTYTTLDDPLAANGTYALGINSFGQIVGYYFDANNFEHGFLLSGGVYAPIDIGSTGTFAAGINDSGQIVGGYFDNNGSHGFFESNDVITPVDHSEAYSTAVYGINNSASIGGAASPLGAWFVGSYTPSYATLARLVGFVSVGNVDFAGEAASSSAYGVNDSGQIVGYRDVGSSNTQGYLYGGGWFTTIADPAAVTGTINGTFPFGINDSGAIVGEYLGSSGINGGQVRELLDIFTWAASFEGCVLRPTWVSYS
jgi:probable HAF family extracellular repeat protein